MIKVFFVTNWQKNTANMFDIYTPEHNGVWGDLRAVNKVTDADYVVVMQGGRPIKNKKTIYFQREPLAHHADYSDAFYNGTYKNHYHVATWWVGRKFKFIESYDTSSKPRKLSAIVSGKNWYPGHKRRLALMKHYAANNGIDWYGREVPSGTPGYKGPLPGGHREKWGGLAPYEYSIAIENSCVRNYFTEKLIDCFLTLTKPIYWGCPNIADYFPPESYASIDITKSPQEVSRTINEEIRKPVNYDALREARHLVMYKYNLWPSIAKIVGC